MDVEMIYNHVLHGGLPAPPAVETMEIARPAGRFGLASRVVRAVDSGTNQTRVARPFV